jgi:sulfur carrier protein ThiS
MGTVHIKILGALIKPEGKSELSCEIGDNTTILEILKSLNYDNSHIKYISATVNEVVKKHNYVLKDNDSITLFTVIGGG